MDIRVELTSKKSKVQNKAKRAKLKVKSWGPVRVRVVMMVMSTRIKVEFAPKSQNPAKPTVGIAATPSVAAYYTLKFCTVRIILTVQNMSFSQNLG